MSQLFAWGGQSTGISALTSFLPKKSQGLYHYASGLRATERALEEQKSSLADGFLVTDRIRGRLKTRLLNQAGTRWAWGHEGQRGRAQPRSVCLGSWQGHHRHCFSKTQSLPDWLLDPPLPLLSPLDCGLPLCPCANCSIVRTEREAADCQVQIWWPCACFEERREVLSPICLLLWGSHFFSPNKT